VTVTTPEPTEAEVAKLRDDLRRGSERVREAFQRVEDASRAHVDAAERLARAARKSCPKMPAVRPPTKATETASASPAPGDLTGKFAKLR
jgi:hypothetical protein